MEAIRVMSLLHHHFTGDGTKAQRAGAGWPDYKEGMEKLGGSLDPLNLKPIFSVFILILLLLWKPLDFFQILTIWRELFHYF